MKANIIKNINNFFDNSNVSCNILINYVFSIIFKWKYKFQKWSI